VTPCSRVRISAVTTSASVAFREYACHDAGARAELKVLHLQVIPPFEPGFDVLTDQALEMVTRLGIHAIIAYITHSS
jgi:hypothetical protein